MLVWVTADKTFVRAIMLHCIANDDGNNATPAWAIPGAMEVKKRNQHPTLELMLRLTLLYNLISAKQVNAFNASSLRK